MTRQALARLLAAVLLLLVSLAPTGEALAHGWAHHAAHGGMSAASSRHSAGNSARTIADRDGEDDHPHPVIDGVVRWGSDRADIVSHRQPVIAVTDLRSNRRGSPWPARFARAPGDLSSGPPPRLRAPPIA